MIAKKAEGYFPLKKEELHLHIGDKPIRDMWGSAQEWKNICGRWASEPLETWLIRLFPN